MKAFYVKHLIFIMAILGLTACSSMNSNFSKLDTVPYVDLEKYTGKWHEIARIDHWFQEGCVKSTATYSLRDDGDIEVINRCRVDTSDGKEKQSSGRAWVTDQHSNAKLKVQFFLSSFKLSFLAGDYWIIDLDENYQYVMVGEQSREYLWILSRTETLPDETISELVTKAKNLDFPVERLIFEENQT